MRYFIRLIICVLQERYYGWHNGRYFYLQDDYMYGRRSWDDQQYARISDLNRKYADLWEEAYERRLRMQSLHQGWLAAHHGVNGDASRS
jgi:hypothetical protein